MSAFVQVADYKPKIYVIAIADLLVIFCAGSIYITHSMVINAYTVNMRKIITVYDMGAIRRTRYIRAGNYQHEIDTSCELKAQSRTLYATLEHSYTGRFQRLPPSRELNKVLDLLFELISRQVY